MKKKLLLGFLILSVLFSFGQNLPNDCQNYIQACDNQSISYNVSGPGIQEIVPPSCSSQENNSFWLRVTIDQPGTLGFTIIPNSTSINEDYDFWVFGPNVNCNNLQTPIRCSTTNPAGAGLSNNHTGLNASSLDTSEGPGPDGDSFLKQLDVLSGESYFIVIDRPIGNSPFTLNWSGTATIRNPFSIQNFDDFEKITLCDAGGDNVEPFDFSILTAPYLGSLLGYSVSYFETIQDATFNTNEIIGAQNVTQATYYARITHNNSSCFIVKPIEINFNNLQPFQVFGCDVTPDGIYSFDTSSLETELLNGLSGFNVSYFDENNVALSSPLPNPFVTSAQTINVELTSTSPNPCTFSTTVEFIINNKPQFFQLPPSLTQLCNENNSNQNSSFANFDTSLFQSHILGGQSGVIVEYYDENNNLLSTPLPNPLLSSSTIITVKLINENDINCFTIGSIPLTVLSLPEIDLLSEEEYVCDNLPNYYITLNAGLLNSNQASNFTYQWSLNGVSISGQNGYNLQINEAGNYTVIVTNSNNCQSSRTIIVKQSETAIFENIEVFDLSDNNTIIVDVSGIGEYLYSLDNQTYQSSNVFSAVSPGVYTVYVKDSKGCGVATQEINVLGAPKFFTPNGDNYNDYWNIKGVDKKKNAQTVVRIFDRYGKLLSQIDPLGLGWNGLYNNHPLPATDYWFTIEFNNGRIVKGHFSLIR